MPDMPPPPGGELDPAPLDRAEEEFWRTFVRAMLVIPRGLDADLREVADLSTAKYGILMTLSESTDRKLRITELADRVALSVSRVSRMVGELENDGLATRTRSTEDGRGQVATLTDAGFRRLELAWPSHLASVRSRVMEHIDPAILASSTEFLKRMVDASEDHSTATTESR